jgi:uncharacterized protein YbjT (DUF2867 family)
MILITGATGTNGRLVVHALLTAGRPVRAMVQDPTRAGDLRQAGAQLVRADFDTADSLDAALAGVERALLLSPVDQRLVERETRFVERAQRAGLRHLVKFSAIGAHPAASFTWGRQHGTAEHLIMDSGLPFTFIQPNFFMQNLLWSADPIKTRGELYSSIGSTPVSHVDARDIAAVITATLTEPLDRHAGRIHLVTGPAELTFHQIVELCSRVVGTPVRYVNLSDDQLKVGLVASGQPEWQAAACSSSIRMRGRATRPSSPTRSNALRRDRPAPWRSGSKITPPRFGPESLGESHVEARLGRALAESVPWPPARWCAGAHRLAARPWLPHTDARHRHLAEEMG